MPASTSAGATFNGAKLEDARFESRSNRRPRRQTGEWAQNWEARGGITAEQLAEATFDSLWPYSETGTSTELVEHVLSRAVIEFEAKEERWTREHTAPSGDWRHTAPSGDQENPALREQG